jgi:hypothetical protein
VRHHSLTMLLGNTVLADFITFNYLHRTVQMDSPTIGDKHG